MRLSLSQLNNALGKELAPLYFVYGDEPLQLGEAADAIRLKAKNSAFEEREIFHVDNHFDWSLLLASAQSLSIFSSRKLIDLRVPEAKFGAEGAKALGAYCKVLPPDTVLLITSGKLTKEAFKSKWFELLDRYGQIVQVKALQGSELENWLAQRAQQRGLKLEPQVIKFLAERVEGNLLAAVQELEKLYVLAGDTKINQEQLQEMVADNARYDVFKLVEAALKGQVKRLIKILSSLKQEGVALPVVLWALARELRLLLDNTAQNSNQLRAGFATQKVTKSDFLHASKKMPKRAVLEEALHLSAIADQQIKGQIQGDPWFTLERICLLLAQVQPLLPLAM